MEWTEKEIEKRLTIKLKELGCLVYKFISPNNAGVPDRIVIYPGGRVDFIELKTLSGRLSPLQAAQIDKLKRKGANVDVLVGLAGADDYVERVRHAIHTA
ncbi:VRR-NUC domain-containing protein [Veillonella sp. KGMB01456]|uniref:VRR-NUC domain-containing protein n=1 Tax=Veillonella sp. KGMB01456 TaxID=2934794 RepID=UPI001FF34BAD|nr:VRR-NUC domain-containing protein [Veillonella sp. KGMB01456]MCK0528896.1 VRR-NUC domain-containing protein [Veillonella sp. KGMB01456]